MLDIVYICTNFNSSSYTLKAYESLMNSYRKANDFLSEPLMIVVDNNSSEIEKELLKYFDDKPNVEVIFSENNVGYFSGLNLGLQKIRDRKSIDLVLVGNNDIVFSESFFIEISDNITSICNHLVVSPDIVTVDGAYQNPHVVHEISSIRELIYSVYYSSYISSVVIRKLAAYTSRITSRGDEEKYKGKPMEIWQGYGAFYILTPSFLNTFNYSLWSLSFITFEEYWLSRQLESVGMKVFYMPGMKVTHQLHSSFKALSSRTKWEFGRESFKVYRRYIKIFPWR